MEPVARLDAVRVSFRGRAVLRDVHLEVPRGRVTVLVGPSGSGKTTLLRTLNRLNELFPGHARSGSVEVRLGGRLLDVHDPTIDPAWLRRRVAMVFQTPNVLPLSIERNLALPLRLARGLGKQQARGPIEEALRKADLLDEVRDRLGDGALTLSGGQQQRLCLARALVLEPEILLLDEPTASLHVRSARRIEELILRLRGPLSVVAVSHGLGQASRIADRVVVLGEGRVVQVLDRGEGEDAARLRRRLEDLL